MIAVALNLAGRLAVVVGGGGAAEQKVRALLKGGADVRVVSPYLTSGLQALEAVGRIAVMKRVWQPGDTQGAALVVAATGRPEVDQAVAAEAATAGLLVSVSSNPAQGNLHFMATVQRGPITIGIATGGASPALARHLQMEIGQAVGPEYGALAELLQEARQQLEAAHALTQKERAVIYRSIISGPALGALAQGDIEGARALVQAAITQGRQRM